MTSIDVYLICINLPRQKEYFEKALQFTAQISFDVDKDESVAITSM